MRFAKFILILFIAGGLLVPACKKSDSTDVDNPYKTVKIPKDTSDHPVDVNASPTSIAGLQRDLFKPTCANSGCHDGNFEPDFRTVESSYNSLLNQKAIKKDTVGMHTIRVIPGNADASILTYRMLFDLGGNSGIMPLVLDPGSDYPAKKNQLIQNVKTWINDGAKDFRGNPPSTVDFPPQVMGVVGLVGATPIGRGGKYEPMYANAGGNIDFWFAIQDDKVAQNALTGMKINWSTDPTNYDPLNEKPLILGTAKTMAGIYNSTTVYNWYYSFSTAGLKSLDVVWFRITCSDGTNMSYQLPNDNSMFFLKKYFALRIL